MCQQHLVDASQEEHETAVIPEIEIQSSDEPIPDVSKKTNLDILIGVLLKRETFANFSVSNSRDKMSSLVTRNFLSTCLFLCVGVLRSSGLVPLLLCHPD